MNKPSSLRNHLIGAVAELKNDPDRVLIFIDSGNVRCTAAPSLSFEYVYELQVILTDFAGHPDAVFLPLLAWLQVNQSELLHNLERSKEAIQFEVDVLANDKVDMSIKLPLTERVVVQRQPDGRYDLSHPEEPQYSAQTEVDGDIQVFANGELLASWPAVAPADVLLLDMPFPPVPNRG
ncbi:hypothetical protein PHLH8_56430 [Pseudomonas sp. Pc102]|uniref:phage tail protein n=1 Tax=Pseudomonas sp. Pc102 TaxID=2678261 RepID=UPI001BD1027C|nr:phage tail protein [Pseudomonas sp. Pc102]BBP86001.1 hypothetical protein PHLH8_56430 [Pseudomonas sp. Pc102]